MQEEQPRAIDTRSATVERVAEALIEIRFKPDVKLDVQGLTEIILTKRKLTEGKHMDVLAILPAELDFEPNVLGADHRSLGGGCGRAQRLAVVARTDFDQRISDLYFRYHPRENGTEIFLTEADARKWLATELPAPSAS